MTWYQRVITLSVVMILAIGVVLMAHGQPAWGVNRSKSTTYQLQDMAELARRLGAPISIDGSGDVIDQDDCEHGLVKGIITGNGTGYAIASDATKARSGAKSYLFTAGSSDAHNVQLERAFAYPVPSTLGIELWFSEMAAGETLELDVVLYTGTRRYMGIILYTLATKTLQVYDAAGVAHTYRTLANPNATAWCWHCLKVVIDVPTGAYVRAIYDQYTDDLSAYSLMSIANASAPSVRRTLLWTGRSGYNDSVYIDDLLTTQNEP